MMFPNAASSEQIASLRTLWQNAATEPDYQEATERLQALVDQFYGQFDGLDLARALESLGQQLPHRMVHILQWTVQWEKLGNAAIRACYPQGGWPLNDHLVFICMGREASRQGDFEQAVRCFLEAVRLRPTDPHARHWLGLALANVQRFQEADLWLDSVKQYQLCQAAIVALDPQRLEEIIQENNVFYLPENLDGAPETDPESVVLLSMDGNYFKKYARRFLLSLHEKMTIEDWLVHIHIVHPDQECLDAAQQYRQQGIPLVLSWSYPELPEQKASKTETIEHRTLYACSRLLLWPWALETYNCPVWIVDCDMEMVAPLPAINDNYDAGFIRFPNSLQPLYQEFFLSASYIHPSREGIRFARAMASYIHHFMAKRLWVWGLDQVALYAVWAFFEQIGQPLNYFSLPSSTVYTKNWSEAHDDSFAREQVVFVNQVGSSSVTSRRSKVA